MKIKKQFRQIAAFLLAFVIILTSGYYIEPVSAQENQILREDVSEEENGGSSAAEFDDISMEGDNSFGTMLANTMDEKMQEQEENEGCNIFSIEVSGKTASVSFETTEYASLIVGIYDEAGTKMLASGKTEVEPGETQADVTIETGTMQQYFLVRGFLVETSSMRPLGSAYESPMYTKEMQDFLAKTTDDFDEERVLNLDGDKKNNFAVFNKKIKLIPENTGHNQVVKADEVKNNYVIENIDSSISSLKQGDTFSYEYEEGNVLIVKVQSISISGTTATITGADTNMEDVFEYVKIDGNSDNVEVDESGCGEGVTYEGEVDRPQTIAFVEEREDEWKKELQFGVETEKQGISISGGLTFSVKAKVKLYISFSYQYMEMRLDYRTYAGINVSGKINEKLPFGKFGVSPVPGVFVEFTPSFVLEVSAKLDIDATLTGTIGFQIDGKGKGKNLTTSPKLDTEIKGEITLFLGLSLEPKVKILSEKVSTATATVTIGAEAVGKIRNAVSELPNPSSDFIHDCKSCIKGEIFGKVGYNFTIQFLESEKLTYTLKDDFQVKIADFYYSLTYGEFAFTTCPHYWYKTNLTVVDEKNKPIKDASITVDKKQFTIWGADGNRQLVNELKTDEKGNIEGYLLAGKDFVIVKTPDNIYASIVVYIKDKPFRTVVTINGAVGDSENKVQVGNVLALGEFHSGVITEDGSLYMWGLNLKGQVGNGACEDYCNTPVKVLNHAISLDVDHSTDAGCSGAITEDGSMYIWGEMIPGQRYLKPEKVLDDVVSMSIGYLNMGCITSDGSLYMYMLTKIDSDSSYRLVKVLDNVESVSVGKFHSGAITKDGSLYMWGHNDYGEVGNGTDNNYVNKPVKVLENVKSVSVGIFLSGAITEDGSLYMWGYNSAGSVGNGTDNDHFNKPVKVLDNVKSLSLSYCSGAVTEDGSLYMWGYNNDGQVGNGTYANCNKPIKVLSNVESVTLEEYRSAAITSDRKLYMWGYNNDGQIGNGTKKDCDKPVKVLDNVVSVSLGANHSGAITADGSLYMWGKNNWGQIGNGTTENQLTPLKIMDHVMLPSFAQKTKTIVMEDQTSPISLTSAAGMSGALQQADFSNLLPNEIYNFYVMKDRNASDAFAASNLLYISQETADASGNLTVSYQPKETASDADVFVIPMKQTDLSSAKVQVENLYENGETQYIHPIVMFNGVKLEEGKDYVLTGDYCAKEAGTYTVTVQGIGLYTGEASVSYQMLVQEDPFVEIRKELGTAKPGAVMSASLSTNTILPKDIQQTMKGKDVTLELTLSSGDQWSINGNDVSGDALSDRDLSITKTAKENGKIPAGTITALAGERTAQQLTFANAGAYGFSGKLSLSTENGNKAEKGVLLQKKGDKLLLTDSALLSKNRVTFTVTEGADSTIIYGTNGDTDGDGTVKLTDMMQILHGVSGRKGLNEAQKGFADVDMNDKVDIQDLMRELHFVSGRSQSVYEAK